MFPQQIIEGNCIDHVLGDDSVLIALGHVLGNRRLRMVFGLLEINLRASARGHTAHIDFGGAVLMEGLLPMPRRLCEDAGPAKMFHSKQPGVTDLDAIAGPELDEKEAVALRQI